MFPCINSHSRALRESTFKELLPKNGSKEPAKCNQSGKQVLFCTYIMLWRLMRWQPLCLQMCPICWRGRESLVPWRKGQRNFKLAHICFRYQIFNKKIERQYTFAKIYCKSQSKQVLCKYEDEVFSDMCYTWSCSVNCDYLF